MKKIISLLLALTVASSAAVSLTGCKLLDRLNEGEVLRVILLGEKPADFATVEAELNKIIEPELGMKVTFEFFDPASMGEKMKLKMAEKDTFDITWTGYCNAYQTAVQMKGLYDITDLLDNIKMKDGSTVKMSDVVDQSYIDSAKVKNRVYGIPCIQVTSNPRCYTIFSSVAEECNIDVEGMQEAALNVTDYDSYAEYLKKITAEKALMEYFLILCAVFTVIIPVLPFQVVKGFMSDTFFYFTLGFTGYFVLGYYLKTIMLSGKTRGLIYLAGIIGLLFTIFGSVAKAYTVGLPYGYYDPQLPNVVSMTIAIFVFFQYHAGKVANRYSKVVSALSGCTLGIYLIHPMVMVVLQKVGIGVGMCPLYISIPLVTVLTFIISLCLAWCMKKLPFIKNLV